MEEEKEWSIYGARLGNNIASLELHWPELTGSHLIVREAGTIVQLHDSRGKGNGFGEQLHHTALMCIC